MKRYPLTLRKNISVSTLILFEVYEQVLQLFLP